MMGVRDVVLPIWGGFCVLFWSKLMWMLINAFDKQNSAVPGILGAMGVILTMALLIYIVNGIIASVKKAGW